MRFYAEETLAHRNRILDCVRLKSYKEGLIKAKFLNDEYNYGGIGESYSIPSYKYRFDKINRYAVRGLTNEDRSHVDRSYSVPYYIYLDYEKDMFKLLIYEYIPEDTLRYNYRDDFLIEEVETRERSRCLKKWYVKLGEYRKCHFRRGSKNVIV